MRKRRKAPGRRNPIARALRIKKPGVVRSAKLYRRVPKHKRPPPDDT